MDKLDIYTRGTRAWFKDAQEGYISASMLEKTITDTEVVLKFQLDSTKSITLYSSTISRLEKTNFDNLPPLRNPPVLEGSDDLTCLSYLHEAAVLHSIRVRYAQEIIYTYSGLVLIAMNPFRKLNIYTPELMRQYAGRPRHELEPHLFAIAEEAYRKMINENINQSIIVSGESGAGKTQSAKYVMRYFAIVDEISNDLSNTNINGSVIDRSSSIEDAVLSTNPIMEAFGNSKTTRNDNSSRFGKYIEILFDKSGPKSATIVGARMRTYLLERSRLVFQPDSERNYHIFYQLCAAVPAAEKKELGLDSWDKFFYLNQGGVGVVPGINDHEEFDITQKGMSTVGISVSTQWDIFKICAALLHMGNISIQDVRGIASIDDSDPSLIKASELLGIKPEEFKKWLCKRQISTRTEKIISNTTCYQAIGSRDSIAKFIYSMLFDWIVKIVNVKLDTTEQSKSNLFIGVLDIYGFEHFHKNSFEQFCINYANEKLQQEFTRHVFKLEQEEYVVEQISWSFIDFTDNQPCIDMIENKLGILDLLDEESRLPSGTDGALVTKLYKQFGGVADKYFEKPRFGEVEFIVKHYALDVTYHIQGFIEKNKDTVSDEQLQMLDATGFGFLKNVITIEPEVISEASKSPNLSRGRAGGNKKPTLGSIFKLSLIRLMETLRQTNPHFIRCIKPNQAKAAFEFESHNVLAQLVACGVLETIKISRAGYPSKQTYSAFANRYYLLIHSSKWKTDAKSLTLRIASSVIKGENKFELGLTKIFFRAGQLAFLEKIRSERFTAIVTLMQRNIIRTFHQRKYKAKKAACIKIQSFWRGYSARKMCNDFRREAAAIKIQKNIKMIMARRIFRSKVFAISTIQRARRAQLYRRGVLQASHTAAAIRIQGCYRVYRQKTIYRKTIKNFIKVQSCIRRHQARIMYKTLKQEAKSVGKLTETNYKLESKIIELSLGLDAKKKEVVDLSRHVSTIEEQNVVIKDRFVKIEAEMKVKAAVFLDEGLDMRKQITLLVEFKDNILKETEKLHGMIRKRDDNISNLQSENLKSQAELQVLREKLKNVPIEIQESSVDVLKKEIASLREQMGRLVSSKYKTERITEKFLNNETETPYSIHTSAAARISLSFFESAAQVTARVAETLGRSNETLESKPMRIRSIEIERDSEQKDRPIRMLEARELEDEVVESLITNLRIPLPSSQTVATRKEIFFPTHLVGYLISQMSEHQMIDRLQELMGRVLKSIQLLTMKFEDDYISAFWLSNSYELLCVVKAARNNLPRSSIPNLDNDLSASGVLASITTNLQKVMSDIYYGWIKEFKKRLSNMIVPSVIENQSLPGYICEEASGMWSNWASKASIVSSFTIDQLLNFLSKLSKTMRCYYMEESISNQILTELLRVIGITAFNHLMMRKKFCTWKRGIYL